MWYKFTANLNLVLIWLKCLCIHGMEQDVWERPHSCHCFSGISSLQIGTEGSKVFSQAGLCWPGGVHYHFFSPLPPLVSACASASVFLYFFGLLLLTPWLWQGHSFRQPSTFMLINCPKKMKKLSGYCVGTLLNSLSFSTFSWTPHCSQGQFCCWELTLFVLTQRCLLLLTALDISIYKIISIQKLHDE